MSHTIVLVAQLCVVSQPSPVLLSAEEAASRALAASPEVQSAQAAALVAEAAAREVSQGIYPRLDLAASYAHVDGFPDGVIETGGVPFDVGMATNLANQVTDPAARALLIGMVEQQASASSVSLVIPRDQIRLQAQLSYPVTQVLFGVLPQSESADAQVRAEALRLEAARAEIVFRAKESFYRYAEASAAVEVAETGRMRAEEQAHRVRAMEAAGLANPADRAVAEARKAAASEMVVRARGGARITRSALNLLLGDADGRVYRVAEEGPPEAAPVSVGALEAEALRRRPELRALRAATESVLHQKDATLAGALPVLGVFGGVEYSNPNPRVIPLTDQWNPSWELGARLSWAPNDLARALRQSDRLDAQASKARAEEERLVRAVQMEVRRAQNDWRVALESLETAKARVHASEEAYRARSLQFESGQAILTDVLDADAELREAELGRLRADIDARVARARLRRATHAEGP